MGYSKEKSTSWTAGKGVGSSSQGNVLPAPEMEFGSLSEKYTCRRAARLSPHSVGLAREMVASGNPPAAVAACLAERERLSPAEAVVRLVELGTGRLGEVRPVAGRTDTPDFRGPQSPVLGLAARAFRGRIQRLGDRVYLDGDEITVPDLVRRARERGVRIRYPGLDPMDRALSGGPSARSSRRPASVDALPALLSGGAA